MRIAVFTVVGLLFGHVTTTNAQTVEKYAGPLDSIQVASIQEIPTANIQGVVRKPELDSNTIVGAVEPRTGSVATTNPESLNTEAFGSTTRSQPVPVAERPQFETAAGDYNSRLQSDLQNQNAATGFHVPQESFNPQQSVIDGNQYIYGDDSRDGLAFGFDNSRLFNPLEGPQLQLRGTPTIAAGFGTCDCCDEWEGFCGIKNLDFKCGCGGLKATPGHLGLPWLGSRENCDQTTPLFSKNRRKCSSRTCKACSNCE